MNEEKRIAVVAKELNMRMDDIIEYLLKKGFKVENKPTNKLSTEMYNALLQKFKQKKSNESQVDKINLGRTVNPPFHSQEVKKTFIKNDSEIIKKEANKVSTPKIPDKRVDFWAIIRGIQDRKREREAKDGTSKHSSIAKTCYSSSSNMCRECGMDDWCGSDGCPMDPQ